MIAFEFLQGREVFVPTVPNLNLNLAECHADGAEALAPLPGVSAQADESKAEQQGWG